MAENITREMHEQQRRSVIPMLWIGMVSIVMLFAGLTSAAIVSHMSGSWIHIRMPQYFILSTISIVLSSITYHMAYRYCSSSPHMSFLYSVLSLGLGLAFGILQFLGWSNLVKQGIYFTGPTSNPAASYLYVITFVHFLHYVGGMVSMLVTLVKVKLDKYKESVVGFKASLIYWHFLDGLWIYLYVFLLFLTNK